VRLRRRCDFAEHLADMQFEAGAATAEGAMAFALQEADMATLGTWRAIGFDLPDHASTGRRDGMEWPVGRVLAELQAEIRRRGAAARELLIIVFNLEHGGARVALRERPLSEDYPSLATVFAEIARACAQDRIAAHQLRCIMFEENEVRLMLVNSSGHPEAYVFPVRPAEAM
jgi:hypothetical protein